MVSIYWDYSTKIPQIINNHNIQNQFATCNYCNAKLKINGGFTSGFKKHIESQHAELFDKNNENNYDILRFDKLLQERLITMLAVNDNISFNNLAKSKGLRTLYKKSEYNIPTSISGIVSIIQKYFTHINSLIKNKIQDKLKFSQKIHLVIDE